MTNRQKIKAIYHEGITRAEEQYHPAEAEEELAPAA